MRHVVLVDEVRFIIFNANIINGIVIFSNYFQFRKVDTRTTFTRYNALNVRFVQLNSELTFNLFRYLL